MKARTIKIPAAVITKLGQHQQAIAATSGAMNAYIDGVRESLEVPDNYVFNTADKVFEPKVETPDEVAKKRTTKPAKKAEATASK